MKKQGQKSGGSRKYGRNKRARNQAMSLYVKGKITFEQYTEMNEQ